MVRESDTDRDTYVQYCTFDVELTNFIFLMLYLHYFSIILPSTGDSVVLLRGPIAIHIIMR